MLKRRNSIPGFQEGGMNVDPVSGNEVPVGSLPEEVRDDVDAKLSPGEFILPADVVRFIGLERLMKMRDEAKKGIQRMADIGQMGNADEVGEESNSTYEDDGFESEIDDILGEVENENNGGDVNDQMKMAFGGYVGSGTDLTKAPKNPAFDVRYYKNKEGATMFITHINGKPMTPIPEGFTAVSSEEAMKVGSAADEEKKKAASTTQQESSYEGMPGDPGTWEQQSARNKKLDEYLTKAGSALTKAVVPGAGLLTLAQKAAGLFMGPQRTDEEAKKIPIESRTGISALGISAQAAGEAAYAEALKTGVDEIAANRVAVNAEDFVRSGQDPATAVQNAIDAYRQSEALTRGAEEEYAALSRSYSPSSTVSPTVSATASPATSREVQTRSLDLGGDSSVGTPDTGSGVGGIDDNWGMAKGGLVAKRQYPTKKKKGKGIAASK